MTDQTIIEPRALATEHIADYLCADFGTVLVLDEDRDVCWLDQSEHLAVELARIACPGIAHLDEGWFCADFVEHDEERDTYVETATGRVVGDFEAVVRECCEDGDVIAYIDGLAEALAEALREGEA